ncbi:hypothetical protein SFRURICE_016368 [Spodoptera frugiperda]|nr:hypothetical protein SFRURICE_016368 [Spodoptera frugiperda]
MFITVVLMLHLNLHLYRYLYQNLRHQKVQVIPNHPDRGAADQPEERRARNAQYERERREDLAQAQAELAEAAGCDPNVSTAYLMAFVIKRLDNAKNKQDIEGYRRTNTDLETQIAQLEASRNTQAPPVVPSDPEPAALPQPDMSLGQDLEDSNLIKLGPSPNPPSTISQDQDLLDIDYQDLLFPELEQEERRARNAQYERERREDLAQAQAELAEAAGCDPNVSEADLLAFVVNKLSADKLEVKQSIEEYRRLNAKLEAQSKYKTETFFKISIYVNTFLNMCVCLVTVASCILRLGPDYVDSDDEEEVQLEEPNGQNQEPAPVPVPEPSTSKGSGHSKPSRPRRGRPTGANRTPLSLEERRARNAQYERERREDLAQAQAELAEAAGCDPNVSEADLLAFVIKSRTAGGVPKRTGTTSCTIRATAARTATGVSLLPYYNKQNAKLCANCVQYLCILVNYTLTRTFDIERNDLKVIPNHPGRGAADQPEERRARNAQYERERREDLAQAQAELAEAAGCDPNVSIDFLFDGICHKILDNAKNKQDIEDYRRTNADLEAQIAQLEASRNAQAPPVVPSDPEPSALPQPDMSLGQDLEDLNLIKLGPSPNPPSTISQDQDLLDIDYQDLLCIGGRLVGICNKLEVKQSIEEYRRLNAKLEAHSKYKTETFFKISIYGFCSIASCLQRLGPDYVDSDDDEEVQLEEPNLQKSWNDFTTP